MVHELPLTEASYGLTMYIIMPMTFVCTLFALFFMRSKYELKKNEGFALIFVYLIFLGLLYAEHTGIINVWCDVVTENESSSFQPVSSISQQQIQDMEARIAKLERTVDEMTNSQVQSTPTKPITQEDIVNVLNVASSILGAACILFAGLLWIDIFVFNSSPNTNSANFDLSLIWFFSGLPLLMFGWFKGFSKIVTFKSEET